MNTTTIIELENKEVEAITGAKLVFTQEQIEDNIVETCVECFKLDGVEQCMDTDDAMQLVFEKLKLDGVIPEQVQDFSFQMPSCERIKKDIYIESDMPQKVIITFML